jgi:hypothetical protein
VRASALFEPPLSLFPTKKELQMLKSLSLATTLALLTSVASAQITTEGYELLPGRASSTTANAGGITLVVRATTGVYEMLAQYDELYVLGIGDQRPLPGSTSSPCEVNSVIFVYQDQDASTQEGFDIVARAEGTTPKAAGAEIFRQTLPSAAAGPAAPAGYRRQVQLMGNAPNTVIPVPCEKTWFFGLELPLLPTNTTWPNDGLTIAASYADTVANYTIFDWPKGGHTSPYLYYLSAGGTGGGHFADRMIFAINLLTNDAPNLQVGALHLPNTSRSGADDNYGAAGIFPEINPNNTTNPGRHDGLNVRFTDNNNGSGVWGLYASIDQNAVTQSLPIFNIPGITGGLYLGLPNFFLLTGVMNTAGPDTIVTLANPSVLPLNLVGHTVFFQGYTVSGPTQRVALTNLTGVSY